MTHRLLSVLQRDFPHFSFVASDVFSWSPPTQTIFYANEHDAPQLLHELAHAELGHAAYARDITLLTMEREAWEYAVSTLAPRYNVPLQFDDDCVQDSLNTYRDWLHARSQCPQCHAVGIETRTRVYSCLLCHAAWTVNEARQCQLRRHII